MKNMKKVEKRDRKKRLRWSILIKDIDRENNI